MPPDLAQRAERLRKALPPVEASPHPEPELPERFREIPGELSPLWLVLVATVVACGALLGALGWMLLTTLANPLQEIGDARVERDYRSHAATGFAVLDERHSVLATLGGGVHLLRLDGGRWGLWRAFDRRSTRGRLPDDQVRQMLVDRYRLFFVGQGGSLASADRRLRDWRVHFGGRGFVPRLDLTAELSALAASPDGTLFAVGTRSHGSALYDTAARQWRPLGAGEQLRPDDRVNRLLWEQEGRLWVGTEKGLSVLEVRREGDRLRVRSLPAMQLPAELRGLPVRALQRSGQGREAVIDCIVGRGAHLRVPAGSGDWTVVVDEGDPALAGLNGPAEVGSLLPVPGGAWIDLPDQGPAFYDAATRRLTLSAKADEGSPVVDGPPVSGRIKSPSAGEGPPEVWMFAANQLYRREEEAWTAGPTFPAPVAALTFAGREPLVRLTNGEVHAGAGAFFQAVKGDFFPGAAEVGDGQLFVSDAEGDVHRYGPALRGWETVLPGGERAPVHQMRWGGRTLWIVREDGETGFLAAEDLSQFRSLNPGTLAAKPGRILTAASLEGDLWFVRTAQEEAWGPWVWNRGSGSFRLEAGGIAKELEPRRMRAVGGALYLWGFEKGALRIYSRTAHGSWSYADLLAPDLAEVVATPEVLLARQAAGPLLAARHGSPQLLLTGRGRAHWREITVDRFGRLWALDDDGIVASYERATGTWTAWDVQASDLLVHPVAAGRDRVFVGTPEGIAVWNTGASAVQGPRRLTRVPVRSARLEAGGGRLWALGADPASGVGVLWSSGLAGQDPRRLWEESRARMLTPGDWEKAVWARTAEDDLWWATRDGFAWRYSLSAPSARSWRVGIAPARVELDAQGRLWWLGRDDTLYVVAAQNTRVTALGRLALDIAARESLAGFLRFLGLLSLVIAVLFGIGLWLGLSTRPGCLASCTLAGLALLTGALYVRYEWTDPVRPFLERDFRGRVETFWVEGAELTVQTAEGLWTFAVKGTELLPRRYAPGVRLPYPGPDPVLRAAPAGPWRVVRAEGGVRLERRTGEGTWQEVRPGRDGLPGDRILSFEVQGDRLLAATPDGVAEYRTGAALEWTRFIRRPATETAPPGPRLHHVAGFRWRSTPSTAELLGPGLDPASGRFLSDVALRLLRGSDGAAWVETRAGWRRVEVSGGAVRLGEPVAAAPAAAPETEDWEVRAGWRCRRATLPGSDAVHFLFAGRPPVNDPFGDRGRWPDEDGRAVLPDAVGAWIATPLGVRRAGAWIVTSLGMRRAGAGGLGPLELAGRQVFALDRRGGTVYAHAEDGDWANSGGGWRRVDAPLGLFPSVRPLRLPLLDGLPVAAVERIEGTQARTALAGFDAERGRFRHDVVEETEGEADGFWAATPVGLQRLGVRDGRIEEHRLELPGRRIAALRRDRQSDLYAWEPGAGVWRRSADGPWVPAAAGEPDNPFTSPLRGSLSQHVRWERRFAQSGDRFVLTTSAGPLAFQGGKLASDFVLAAAGEGETVAQATPAGIVTPRGVLPQPPAAGAEAPAVRVHRGDLVARTGAGTFRYDPGTKRWVPGPASVLTVPEARFDGLRWSVRRIVAPRGRFAWTELDGEGQRPLLNDRGQFFFDAVRGGLVSGGEIRLIHDAGVTAYPTGVRDAESFVPLRWRSLAGREVDFTPRVPHWEGLLGGQRVTARLLGSQVVQVEQAGGRPLRYAFSGPVLHLAGARRAVWVLTTNSLYRLELR